MALKINQGMVIEEWPLFTGWSLCGGVSLTQV